LIAVERSKANKMILEQSNNSTLNNMKITTETQRKAAEDYFLSLAEVELEAYKALCKGAADWQFHRDRYVELSNAAARLMGESIPFQD
jgi:hypothetical protein